MARILILGGGFAAISAAETLAPFAAQHEIIVISKSSDLTFYPAIVPLILGKFKPEEIRFDLRARLAAKGITFLQGDVRSIDTAGLSVHVSRERVDETLGFDYLIIALGPRIGGEEIPGLAEYSHSFLTVEGAFRFRAAIENFRSGSIVLGLSPGATLPVPACEIALALSDKFWRRIKRGDINVTVVFPNTPEKAFAGATLFRDVETEFNNRGIEVAHHFAVSAIDADKITAATGAALPYDLLALIPPTTTEFGVQDLGSAVDVAGFLEVNEFLRVAGADRIYAAGDVVSLPGPRFGYMAVRQGKIAATNILAELGAIPAGAEYVHRIAWVLKEKYTSPNLFHYGVWDETLPDFDNEALLGIAKAMRGRYGSIKRDGEQFLAAA